jgi:hypothetical protein
VTSVQRSQFASLGTSHSLDLDHPTEANRATLEQLGLTVEDLRAVDLDGDHVIRGEGEWGALFDRLETIDRSRPRNRADNLSRANEMYDSIRAGRTQGGDSDRFNAGTITEGRGREAREVQVYVHVSQEVRDRAAAIRALPVSGSGRGREPVGAYLDALAARERNARTAPEGVPAHIYNLSRAAQMRGITHADLEHYLATGRLPDLVDADGTVRKTGDQRFEELERAATQEGSWTAVNTLTYLVNMRRSAIASQRDAIQSRLDGMAADAPERADLEQTIRDADAFETSLRRGLSSIYTAATMARERTAQGLVGRSQQLSEQARAARDSGDVAGAARLEAESASLRDRGARMASSEATYRSGLRGTGWDASRAFDLAAQAQIMRGGAEIEAQSRAGTVAQNPPASLGMAEDAGNGVPGAGLLLERSRANSPDGGRNHRTLGLEMARQGTIATFHQSQLGRTDFYARVSPTSTPAVRTDAQLQHRAAYLDARASQADAAGQRLALYGDPSRLSGPDAEQAALVARERRVVLEEMAGSLGQSVASDRVRADATTRRDELTTALGEARTADTDARQRERDADAGVGHARDNADAVFGDTFKTDGEARRDRTGVTDAERIAAIEREQREFASQRVQAMEIGVRDANAAVGRAEIQARRDREDADLVRRTLDRHASLAPGGHENARRAYDATRVEADATARRQEGYIDRAIAQLPPRGDERTQGRTRLAGMELDLSGYWTRSADLDGQAVQRRDGAVARLDRAAGLVDRADGVRTGLAAGDPGREALAGGVIVARTQLAEANADYRNGVARDQLQAAEAVLPDLANDGEATRAARGRIGSAAVMSLVRHDARFDEVARSGGYVANADDAMYAQAHRMLDGDRHRDTEDARALLGRIDRSLDRVDDILSVSAQQLQNGFDYSSAQTRSMSRSEIAAAQAQVSSVISGGAWLITLGHVDMHEEMADAGEHSANMRQGHVANETARLVSGAQQLGGAWTAAGEQGRRFEMLGALRILGDRENRERMPAAYANATLTMGGLLPSGGSARSQGDWQDFQRVAIRDGEVPVASALRGPVLGLEQAYDSLGDRDIGVVTSSMRDMMQSQADSLRETTDGMGWIIATNVTLEFVGGLVLTGGLGSAAAVGEGANALNAGRTGLQAMNAARSVGAATRGAQALNVMRTMGTTAAVGAGMYGVSWGTRRLFGASSGVSRGVDVLANIVPIGAGQRAAGLPQRLEGAAARVAQAEGVAARATLGQRLLAHAHFYGPQAAIGGAQIYATTLATPWIAEQLGVRSDVGQAAIGLALNTVMSGGIAYGVARSQRGSVSERTAAHLMTAAEGPNRTMAQSVRGDVDGFVRQTQGRMPTADEVSGLRTRLYQRLGIPESGGGDAAAARRRHVDSTVEALRIDRATSLGMGEVVQGRSRRVTADEASRSVDATATRLYEARRAEDPNASRVQAYRDAADAVARRLDTGNPAARGEVQAAALDRARAVEIAEGFSRGNEPVIRDAAVRGRVENIVASELGAMRRSVESGEGPALTQRSNGQPSSFERLGQRLRDAGLSSDGAESVVRSVQHEVVERTVEVRIARAQAEATGPLSEAQIRTVARETAERAGLDSARADRVADDLVSRAGFLDWARSWLPPRHWTAAQHREHFLRTADPATRQELQGLGAAEMSAMYPDGPIPRGLDKVGRIPGFAQFARTDPAAARVIADAATLFGGVRQSTQALVQQHGAAGFQMAAQQYRPMLPVVTPHPTNPNYVVVTRGPQSPSFIPAYNLRPRIALDHNGAFHQSAQVPGRVHGERRVATPNVDFVVMRPDQLIVNGAPLTSMDGVMVFSGHGGLRGFSGLNTRDAARMVADQVRAARASGQRVDYLVLDACHQRDRRFFFGSSNGEAFQAALNRELGGQSVTVMAADRGGPTYGAQQRSYLPMHRDQQGQVQLGYEYTDARYTPADHGRTYVSKQDWIIGGTIAGVGAEGAILYYVVGQQREAQRREERQQRERPNVP